MDPRPSPSRSLSQPPQRRNPTHNTCDNSHNPQQSHPNRLLWRCHLSQRLLLPPLSRNQRHTDHHRPQHHHNNSHNHKSSVVARLRHHLNLNHNKRHPKLRRQQPQQLQLQHRLNRRPPNRSSIWIHTTPTGIPSSPPPQLEFVRLKLFWTQNTV